jgi:hypothetical protein
VPADAVAPPLPALLLPALLPPAPAPDPPLPALLAPVPALLVLEPLVPAAIGIAVLPTLPPDPALKAISGGKLPA